MLHLREAADQNAYIPGLQFHGRKLQHPCPDLDLGSQEALHGRIDHMVPWSNYRSFPSGVTCTFSRIQKLDQWLLEGKQTMKTSPKQNSTVAAQLLWHSPVKWAFRHKVLCAAAVATFALSANISMAQGTRDPDADKALQAMSTYLSGLKTFSVDVDIENEVVLKTGEKLQFSSSGDIAVKRPDKLHVTRKGVLADAELTFDGKMLSIYGHRANVYAEIASPGPSIDAAIEEVRMQTGLDFPGADLFVADPDKALTEDLVQSTDVGIGYVSGIACDHLAFRKGDVDWQIWVQQGEHPLPMKYVITSKWITGAPQYTIRFNNWNVDPKFDAKTFNFAPPKDAKKLSELQSNEIGELTNGEEQ
jgi:hypothetical protein